MSDMDGLDAFNRLLERVEELSGELELARDKVRDSTAKVRELTEKNDSLTRFNKGYGQLERFVESSPEMEKAWADFRASESPPKPPKPSDDDMPF